MWYCRPDATNIVIFGSVVHGSILVRTSSNGAHSFGDTGCALQLTCVSGIGNTDACASYGIGYGLEGFSSWTDCGTDSALSVARACQALQVAQRIQRARHARQ